jgi:hypothetical protein
MILFGSMLLSGCQKDHVFLRMKINFALPAFRLTQHKVNWTMSQAV